MWRTLRRRSIPGSRRAQSPTYVSSWPHHLRAVNGGAVCAVGINRAGNVEGDACTIGVEDRATVRADAGVTDSRCVGRAGVLTYGGHPAGICGKDLYRRGGRRQRYVRIGVVALGCEALRLCQMLSESW